MFKLFISAEPILKMKIEAISDDSSSEDEKPRVAGNNNQLDDSDDSDESNDEPEIMQPAPESDSSDSSDSSDTADAADATDATDGVSSDDDSDSSDEDQPRMSEEEKEKYFESFINSLNWVHKTDGEINKHSIIRKLKGCTNDQLRAISEVYSNKLTRGLTFIDIFYDGVYKKEDTNAIISHFIAMGEDWYNQFISGSEMALFIIQMNEYQNFDKIACDELKYALAVNR